MIDMIYIGFIFSNPSFTSSSEKLQCRNASIKRTLLVNAPSNKRPQNVKKRNKRSGRLIEASLYFVWIKHDAPIENINVNQFSRNEMKLFH